MKSTQIEPQAEAQAEAQAPAETPVNIDVPNEAKKRTKNNANPIADVRKHNVERQLRKIAENGNLHFRDVTFSKNGYPTNVGEYRALVGFQDQYDAKRWSELTDGEFSMFYKKNGWQLLSYRGPARITNIYTLAGRYIVAYLEGSENYHELCDKVFGMSLIDYIVNSLDDIDNIPESWITTAIESYVKKTTQYPEGISEEDEDYYDEIESKIRERLRYLDNFKGCRGYTVLDDVNWSVEGEYENEYPAHYKGDNRHYFFGVMYKQEREDEIKKIIEG